jgi:hypothetical protein
VTIPLPALSGVPVMAPVLVFNDNPEGSEPLVIE